MESLWTFGMNTMFSLAGKPCLVKLDGVVIPFNGILDRVLVEEENETGRYVREDSGLRVDRDIASKLRTKKNHPIQIDGREFIYTEVKYEDDGETALVMIYPKNKYEAC